MRCPKCGYNSFDHNLTCPKCRKDLTATRRLLNLTMPAPGEAGFFQIAGQRMVEPAALLDADEIYDDLQPVSELTEFEEIVPADATQLAGGAPAEEIFPVGADDELMTIEPEEDDDDISPIEPDDLDDIAPDDELEELVPDDDITPDDDIAPDYLLPDDDIAPDDDIEPDAEDLAPPVLDVEPEPDQAEEEIEIEIEELEIMEAENEEPAAAASPVPIAAPAHLAAMDQIKSTLTETGDLSDITAETEDEAAEEEPALYVLGQSAGEDFSLDLNDDDSAADELSAAADSEDSPAPDENLEELSSLSLEDLEPDGQADETPILDELDPPATSLSPDELDAAEEVSLETGGLDLAIEPEPTAEGFPPAGLEAESADLAVELESLPDIDVSIGEGDDFNLDDTPIDPEALLAETPPEDSKPADDLAALIDDDINLDDLDNKL